MKFPYHRYDVQAVPGHREEQTLYRPLVPIRIIGPRGDARVLGLVDIGADATILPAFLIESLGILVDPAAQSRFRGVGNQIVTVRNGTVDLEIATKRRSRRWQATVGFLAGRTVAILGHAGFLEHFVATFNSGRRELTLRDIAAWSVASRQNPYDHARLSKTRVAVAPTIRWTAHARRMVRATSRPRRIRNQAQGQLQFGMGV